MIDQAMPVANSSQGPPVMIAAYHEAPAFGDDDGGLIDKSVPCGCDSFDWSQVVPGQNVCDIR
jgi:hypothetical protein